MPNAAIIIMICILIVTGSVGVFIIKTMTGYKDRSLYFGKEKIKDIVGNAIEIDQVYGRGPGDKTVQYLYLYTRLREGSDPLGFNTTLLHVVANGKEGDYIFDEAIDCKLNPYFSSAKAYVSNSTHVHHFGASFSIQIEGDNSTREFLTPGDVVQFCVPLAGTLREAQEVRITVVSEHAGKKLLEFVSPDVLAGDWILLYEKLV
jgi:archaellin